MRTVFQPKTYCMAVFWSNHRAIATSSLSTTIRYALKYIDFWIYLWISIGIYIFVLYFLTVFRLIICLYILFNRQILMKDYEKLMFHNLTLKYHNYSFCAQRTDLRYLAHSIFFCLYCKSNVLNIELSLLQIISITIANTSKIM